MNNKVAEAYDKLEQSVYAALETYSNVHRGSGHFSTVSTRLYEQARTIVLEHLGLNKRNYTVIFCTPRRAKIFSEKLKVNSEKFSKKGYHMLSSLELGLPLGVRALAVRKNILPGGVPFQTGGGNARLVSPGSVIWAGAPDRFEAGTPSVINVIAFARALQLIRQHGDDVFRKLAAETLTAREILYEDELAALTGRDLLEALKQTRIGSNIHVPTTDGFRPYINLDYAASTPAFMPVWKAARNSWDQSLETRQGIIQEVRAICSGVLGAPLSGYSVIFTANTTEAINLAAESFRRESEPDIEPVVLNTLLEHNSNELPWRMIPDATLIRMNVDHDGFLDPDELENILRAYNQDSLYGKKRIKLMAVSGASNVLGVYNDLAEISRIVHRYGARMLVDAAQLVAHRSIEMESWGIDYLAFSAHKAYAPFGTGVLLGRKGLLRFNPEETELIRSSGEENVTGIAALGKALVLLQRVGFDTLCEEEKTLTARALTGMSRVPGIRIYGITDPASPRFAQKGGVIVFDLKNIFPNVIARELAAQGGIGVRYGCHCAHMLIKHMLHIPPLLERFQSLIVRLFPRLNLPGMVRVSLGIGSTEAEVDTFIRLLAGISGKRTAKKEIRHQAEKNLYQ